MPEAHSEWSASGFKKIMLCPGSKVLEAGKPDSSSIYAAEGTAAHELLEMCLTSDRPASAFEGRIIEVVESDRTYQIEVDADMVDHIQSVIDLVKQYQGDDGVLMVEQKLYYADYLGVPRETGWGTGDIVIARGNQLIVGDLKYGRGVEVDVEENPQLMLYGLGGLDKLNGIAGDFEKVTLVIFQPRISRKPSEWDTTVEDLEAWGRGRARNAVLDCQDAEDRAQYGTGGEWAESFLSPGEDQCRFCRGKAECPKLRAEVALTVSGAIEAPMTPDEFEDLTIIEPGESTSDEYLSLAMAKTKLIEEWISAVRAEVERRLLAGKAVPGYKLVQGKQGNRAWTSKTEAEEAMKAMRLKQDEMYDRTVISPTTAEKLLAKDSPRRWAKLQAYITRSEGKPSVAPASDKRAALEIKPVADEFDVVAETFDDLA